ncbi:MAG: hypothetical protein R3B09_34665 [Nannocystaceae bacterium]
MAPPIGGRRERGLRLALHRVLTDGTEPSAGGDELGILVTLLALALVALALLALTACDPPEDEGPRPSPAEYFDAHLEGLCDGLARCGEYESAASCRALVGPGYVVDPDLEAAIAGGSVVVDGAAARACLEFLADAPCVAQQFVDGADEAGCSAVFAGTRGGGEPCFLDAECDAGRCLMPRCADACCPGFCVEPPPPAELGGSCAVASCVPSAYCRPDIEICTHRRDEGSPCDGDEACRSDLVCAEGRCAPPPDLGEPCAVTCGRLGLRCGPRGICVAAAFEGAPCDPVLDGCGGLLRCDPSTSTCRRPPAIGEPCHVVCAAGAVCDDVDPETFHGTCAALRDDDDPCEADAQCRSQACHGGRCGSSRCVE